MTESVGRLEASFTIDLSGLRRGLAQAKSQMQAFSGDVNATVKVETDGIKQAQASMKSLRSSASSLDGTRASLGVDLKGASQVRAGLEAISNRADRLDGGRVSISTDLANGQRVISQLEGVAGVASRIDGDTVKVTADVDGTEQGRAALQALQSAASSVDGDNIRLSAEVRGVSSAIGELTALNAAASRVDGQNVRVKADSSAIGILDRVGQSISDTAQRIRNFQTIAPTVALPGLLGALGAIPALASSAAAAVGGLASALGQALAGAAGIGGSALAGMGAGFGLLLGAAQPTISAFSNMESATNAVSTAQNSARSAAESLADAQRDVADAARGVREAQASAAQGVADAQAQYQDALRGVEDAQRGVAEAERGVADARREANAGVVQAQQQYQDAIRGVEDAERQLADATRGVAEARREAQQGVAEAQSQYRDAVRGVEDAERSLADATRGVADARREAAAGVAQAQGQYRDAVRAEEDAQRSLREAVAGVGEARREAYEGVQQAQQQYQDSLRGVEEAERGVGEARRTLDQATQDLYAAQKDLNQALADEPLNQRQATLDLAEARDRASDAQRDYNEAVREHGRNSEEATDAQRRLAQANLSLEQTERDVNRTRREGSDELQSAKEGVRSASESERQARQGVADSERALTDARREAAESYQGIAAAQQEGAQKIADAQSRVAEAQRGVEEAARKTAEAQAGIEEARVEGARKIADAQRQVSEAQRGVQDAQRKVAEAAQSIEQARIEGARKVADAQRQVADAQRGVQEANRKAAQAAQGIEAARVEGARKVADAQRQVADAQRGVQEANRRAAEAAAAVEQARIDGAKQVADAQRRLLDAQRQLAKATRDNKDAQSELAEALSAVGAKLTATQQKLLSAAKRFGAAFSSAFRPANDAINMLGVRVLGVAQRTLPILGRTATRTVGAVNNAFSTLLSQWTAPRQLDLFKRGLAAIPQFTRLGVQAAGQLGTALANIFIAAIPQARGFLQSLDSVTRRFNAWTASVEGQRALSEFFRRSAMFARQLGGAVVDAAIGFKQLFGALDSSGTTQMMVNGLGSLASRFRQVTAEGTRSRQNLEAFFRSAQPTISALGSLVGSLFRQFGRVSSAVLRMRDSTGQLVMPQVLNDMRGALRAIGDLLIASFRNFGPLVGPAIQAIAELMTIFVANNPVLRTFSRILVGVVQGFVRLDNWLGPVGSSIQTLVVSLVSLRVAMTALGIGKWMVAPLLAARTRMMGLTASTTAATGRMAALRVAMLSIVWPVAIAAALGATFVTLYNRSNRFKNAVDGLGKKLIGTSNIAKISKNGFGGLKKALTDNHGASQKLKPAINGIGTALQGIKGKLQGVNKDLEKQGGGIANIRRQWQRPPIYKRQDWGGKIISLWNEMSRKSDQVTSTIARHYKNRSNQASERWMGRFNRLKNNQYFPWLTSVWKRVGRWGGNIADIYKNRSDDASNRWMDRFNKLKNGQYFPWLTSVWKRVGRWGGNIADIYKNRSDDASNRWMDRFNRLKNQQYFPWLKSVWSRVGKWGGNISDIYDNRSKDAGNRWMDRMKSLRSRMNDWLTGMWSRIKKWGGNIGDIFKQVGQWMTGPIEAARDTLKGIWNTILEGIGKVLGAVGLKDKAKALRGAKWANGGTTEGGGGQAFANGGVSGMRPTPGTAFASGGMGTSGKQPRMHLWNEQMGNEAYITERGSRRKQMGYLETAADWHNADVVPRNPKGPYRGAGSDALNAEHQMMAQTGREPVTGEPYNPKPITRHIADALGATHHNIYDYIKPRVNTIMGAVGGIDWNTYRNHVTSPGANEHSTVDFWAGRRGANIGRSKGMASAEAAINKTRKGLLGVAAQGKFWNRGSWRPYPSAPHYDHTHVAWSADKSAGIISGGGGGGFLSSLWDTVGNAIWGRLVQRPFDSATRGMDTGFVMKQGAKAAAQQNVLDPVKNWIIGESGSSGSSGKGSPEQVKEWIRKGLPMGGAFPATSSNVNKMAGRAMQESGGNPNAINRWDSNWLRGTPSKGLFQIIEPTWNSHSGGIGGFDANWNDPVKSAAVASRYMKSRYGSIVGSNGKGYSRGGVIPGAAGAPKQLMAHAGERVLPTDLNAGFESLARSIRVWDANSGSAPGVDIGGDSLDLREQNKLLREQNDILKRIERDAPGRTGAAVKSGVDSNLRDNEDTRQSVNGGQERLASRSGMRGSRIGGR